MQIVAFRILPENRRQKVKSALTGVPLSMCRMLEDDLKISSDEEEAEQQVSILCSSFFHSLTAHHCLLFPHLSFSYSSTNILKVTIITLKVQKSNVRSNMSESTILSLFSILPSFFFLFIMLCKLYVRSYRCGQINR